MFSDDWATVASLATAGGTLVLAIATFAAVRSANRAARATERALLAGIRPVLVPSRLEDPQQKVGFMDDHWVRVDGGRAVVDVTDDAIYLVMSVRNVGNGLAMLEGWDFDATRVRGNVTRPDPSSFRRLTWPCTGTSTAPTRVTTRRSVTLVSEDFHRDIAVERFSAVWDLIDKADRTPDDDVELVLSAMTSRWHWSRISGAEEVATGDWQVAHAASLLGLGDLALLFAERNLTAADGTARSCSISWQRFQSSDLVAARAGCAGTARPRRAGSRRSCR